MTRRRKGAKKRKVGDEVSPEVKLEVSRLLDEAELHCAREEYWPVSILL